MGETATRLIEAAVQAKLALNAAIEAQDAARDSKRVAEQREYEAYWAAAEGSGLDYWAFEQRYYTALHQAEQAEAGNGEAERGGDPQDVRGRGL